MMKITISKLGTFLLTLILLGVSFTIIQLTSPRNYQRSLTGASTLKITEPSPQPTLTKVEYTATPTQQFDSVDDSIILLFETLYGVEIADLTLLRDITLHDDKATLINNRDLEVPLHLQVWIYQDEMVNSMGVEGICFLLPGKDFWMEGMQADGQMFLLGEVTRMQVDDIKITNKEGYYYNDLMLFDVYDEDRNHLGSYSGRTETCFHINKLSTGFHTAKILIPIPSIQTPITYQIEFTITDKAPATNGQ